VAIFSARVHNVPEVHPASYTMNTGTFPGVNRPWRGVNYPSLSSAEVKERVHLLPSWDFMACSMLYFSCTILILLMFRCYTTVKQSHGSVKDASSRLHKQAI